MPADAETFSQLPGEWPSFTQIPSASVVLHRVKVDPLACRPLEVIHFRDRVCERPTVETSGHYRLPWPCAVERLAGFDGRWKPLSGYEVRYRLG